MKAAELLAAKKLRTHTLRIDVGGESVELHLRALPRSRYRELLAAHPSNVEGEDWDADAFPPALIAESLIDPEFTLDQAIELWRTWEDEEATRLFLACFYLNESQARLSFISPGSARTGGSGQNSTTAPPSESPTQSS